MQTQSNELNFKGQNIYVGFDVHLKSWKVTILTDELSHKTFVQPPKPEVLFNYLKQNFPGGIYHSAYEAGFCGYWIHNKLISLGINSMVVNPADIPTTNKEVVQKEDMRVYSYQGTRKIEAGYYRLHTSETLIGYTACYTPLPYLYSFYSLYIFQISF